MNTDFYKIDLHIHTPASHCYTGPKNDDEYFEILRTAHEQNLDIIALTDHNTIAGYERLFSLKKELENKRNILSEFKDSTTQVNDALTECEEKLSLFNNILIIPGVEITLNPGVHMLVLTTPDKLSFLSELLDSIGYTQDKRGSDCDIEINIDIKNFLSNRLLENFVVIAPHIDSNKGIYNCLSGQFRGEIMRSPVINAFSCNARSQKEKIINLFKNEPTYKRDFIPAFINCSDAHNIGDIGKKFSYIKLQSRTLNDMQTVFLMPDGKISDTSDQRLEKNILKLIEDETPILISDTSHVNTKNLSQFICASLNENINYIILGVTHEKQLVGIKGEESDFQKLITEAINLVDSQYLQLRYSTTIETLGNGNKIVIVYMESSVNCLWYTANDQVVYLLENDTPVTASITQIESLIQENTLLEIEKLEQKNQQTATNIGAQLLSLTNTLEKHKLIQEIMSYSIPLLSIYNFIAHNASNMSAEISDKYFADNGQPNGNIYFVMKYPTRLPDAILRYSCPATNVPTDTFELLDSVSLSTNSIIISQNGGTHIATQNLNIVGKETNYLILTPLSNENISPFAILAWLKSSLFTWYVYKRYNTTNIYFPEILREIVVPYQALIDISSNAETIIKDIITDETNFLTQTTKDMMCKNCEKCTGDNCIIDSLLEQHNKLIDQKTCLLDKLIFETFSITEKQKAFIKEDLQAAGIHNII